MPDQKTVEILFKLIDEASASAKKIASSLKDIDSTATKTAATSTKTAAAIDKVGVSGTKAATGLDKTKKSSDAANTSLGKTGKTANTTSDSLDNLGKANSLGRLKTALTDTNQSLTSMSIAVGAVGAALAAPFILGVSKASEFEAAMSTVQAVSGATTDEFKAMNDVAKELGATTRYTASEAASGFKYLSMAGLEAAQSMEALPSVLQLAQAGALDLGRAADITTNILTGYGMAASELGHVNDVLVKGFTSSNSTLEELGTAFTYVGPIAKGVGADFEGLVGTLGSLHNAGIKGSMAGTTLRSSLDALYNPTKQEAEQLAELSERIGGVGLQIKDSEGNFVGFTNLVEQLEVAGISAEDALKLFGQRAGPGMVALLQQGSDKLGEFDEKLNNVDGTAAQIAETMDDNFAGSMKRLSSAVDGILISIGEGLIPIFGKLVDAVTWVVSRLTELHEFLGPFAVVIDLIAVTMGVAAVAAAALGAAWTLLGAPLAALIVEISYAGGVVALLTGAFSSLTAAVSAAATAVIGFLLTNPVGWAILAVTAIGSLVAAFTLFREDLDETIETQDKLAESNKAVTDSLTKYESEISKVSEGTDEYKNRNLKLRESLVKLASENENLSELALKAAGSIDKATGAINDQGAAIDALKQKTLSEELAAMAESARATEEKFTDLTRGISVFGKIWNNVVAGVTKAWEIFSGMWKAEIDFILGGMSKLGSLVGISLPKSFSEFADAADDAIFGTKRTFDELSDVVDGFGDVLTEEEREVKAAFDNMSAEGEKLVTKLLDLNEVDLSQTTDSILDIAIAEGLLEDKTGNLAKSMTSAFTKMQKSAKDKADKTVKSLLKITDPKVVNTDKLVSAYDLGMERIINIQKDANDEMIDNTDYFGDETISQYADIFGAMTDEQKKGFLEQFSTHESHARDIYNSSFTAAEKAKALEVEKLNFIVGLETRLAKEVAAEKVKGFDDTISAVEAHVAKQLEIQEEAYREQIAASDGSASEILRIETENVNKRIEIEGGRIAKNLALSEENVQNAITAYGKNSDEHLKAVEKQKGYSKELSDYRISETNRWADVLKGKLADSLAKEREYADKINELTNKIRDAKVSTEDKIRSIRQRGMDEAQKQADLQLQADEKLTASKRALAEGDYERAEAFAKASQDIASGLDNESAAISGVSAAGKQLTGIYEEQKKATEDALVAQKKTSEELADSLKNVSSVVQELVNELKLLRGVDIPITADTSAAVANVDALLAKTNAAKGDLSITAEVETGGAITSLSQLTAFTGKFQSDIGEPTTVQIETSAAQKKIAEADAKAKAFKKHNSEPWGFQIEVDGVMRDVDRMGRIIEDVKDDAEDPTTMGVETGDAESSIDSLGNTIQESKGEAEAPVEFDLKTDRSISSVSELTSFITAVQERAEIPSTLEIDSTEATTSLNEVDTAAKVTAEVVESPSTMNIVTEQAALSLATLSQQAIEFTTGAESPIEMSILTENAYITLDTLRLSVTEFYTQITTGSTMNLFTENANLALTEVQTFATTLYQFFTTGANVNVITENANLALTTISTYADTLFTKLTSGSTVTVLTEAANGALSTLSAKATEFLNYIGLGGAVNVITENASMAFESVRSSATELFGFLTTGDQLGVDTTEAEGKLDGVKSTIPTIGDEPFAITADTAEAEASIDELSQPGQKTIAMVSDDSAAKSSISALETPGSKTIAVTANDSAARSAISALERTTHSTHVIHVQKQESNSTGGVAGALKLAGGGKARINLDKGRKLPGYGFQDVVPALLTWGERVLNAKTTKVLDDTYPGMMESVNQAKSPSALQSVLSSHVGNKKLALGGVAKFETGGVASQMAASIVDGATTSDTDSANGAITLSMPINIKSEGDNAEQLERSFRETIIPALKDAVVNNTGSITSVLKRTL